MHPLSSALQGTHTLAHVQDCMWLWLHTSFNPAPSSGSRGAVLFHP